MTARILLFIGFLLPWFTLFFARSETIRRFMPVTIFTCLLMTIVFQIAYTYDWWEIHEYIVPWGYMIDISFAYGVFAVGTFWIFRFTYHRFSLFILINFILDAFTCYVALPLLTILGIAEYKNIAPWQYLLIIFSLSFIIYYYQKWQEKIFSPSIN
jgi:hypothetical protein